MKKGFTLIETLIAISIFAMSAIIAGTILIDVIKLNKKSSIQADLYEDLLIILQQISNEIQAGTIDYEEYYNIYVVQGNGGQIPTNGPYYGINYGVYGSRFYDPGRTIYGGAVTNPEDLGVECTYPSSPTADCEVYFTDSVDLNTGENPYHTDSSDPDSANAFCDDLVGNCTAPMNEVNELYLIDSTGTKKTIIGRKLSYIDSVNGATNYVLGLVRMDGKDLDQNGVIDVFSCNEDFNCYDNPGNIHNALEYPFIQDEAAAYITENEITLPQRNDLNTALNINDTQFVPISPLRSTIRNLRFIIEPMEDPYKAYAERDMQGHPSVTIILTVGLASETAAEYPGNFQDITVQTTVAAGVLGKIDSYPSVNDVLRTATDESWITNVLPNGVN